MTPHCKEAWATINALEQKEELSDEEKETLSGLKNRFMYCRNLCRLPNCKIGSITWEYVLLTEGQP